VEVSREIFDRADVTACGTLRVVLTLEFFQHHFAYACSKRERSKIEALFSELKLRVGLRRVRLRRLWNVAEQFYLAATAQNLKRLVKFLAQRESFPVPCAT